MSAAIAYPPPPVAADEDDEDDEHGCVDWMFEDDEPPLVLATAEPMSTDDDDEPEDEAALAAHVDPPAPPPEVPEPVWPPRAPCDVVVGAGDCLLSLARRYETSVDAIWSAGQNAELRERRKLPNQLLPGDVVHVPAKAERSFRVATERRHRFVLSEREDCEVVIRLRRRGEDRASLAYTLVVDGRVFEGATDATGRVRVRVPRSARTGTLVLHDPDGEERYPVRLGHLDPLDEDAPLTGAQARLAHLGFWCGAVDGVLGPRTRSALRRFQRSAQLEPTGELDAATLAALGEAHGS